LDEALARAILYIDCQVTHCLFSNLEVIVSNFTLWMRRTSACVSVVLGVALVAMAPTAQGANVAWAGAESGFNGRTVDVYSAYQTNGTMTAQAGIGYAMIEGQTSTDKIPSYARNRADFTVHGITANTPLTFNFEVQGSYRFVADPNSSVAHASGAWTAFVEAGLPYPSGGSYSMFGNLVVQNFQGSLGNPNPILQCNGNTRGQAFCSQRRDFSSAQTLSVSGVASEGSAGWVTEELTAAGVNAEMSVTAYLVSVTVPDSIYFAGGGQPAAAARSALAFSALSADAYLEWGDGSRFDITLADAGGGTQNIPEPGTLALMALGMLGCVRRLRT
jgi:hypothetical protein